VFKQDDLFHPCGDISYPRVGREVSPLFISRGTMKFKIDFDRDDLKGATGVLRRVNEMACGGMLLAIGLNLAKSSLLQIFFLILFLVISLVLERFERRL